MLNPALETALMFAGKAGDIEALKGLARAESVTAQQVKQILVAVLREVGPVRLRQCDIDQADTAFTVTRHQGDWEQEGGYILLTADS